MRSRSAIGKAPDGGIRSEATMSAARKAEVPVGTASLPSAGRSGEPS